MKIVLASTSAYRRMLLERLQLPFETDRQVFRVEAGRITPE